jgi:hypothetical protein
MSHVRWLFFTVPITLLVFGAIVALWRQGGTTGADSLNVMDVLSAAFGFLAIGFRVGIEIGKFIVEMITA